MEVNNSMLDCICASLCEIMGVKAPPKAAPAEKKEVSPAQTEEAPSK